MWRARLYSSGWVRQGHLGEGPCRRHGGMRWQPGMPTQPKSPPEWGGGERPSPYPTLRAALEAAKHSERPFAQAWADALYNALDGLPAGEFRDWAYTLLGTWRGWELGYEDRHTPLRHFNGDFVAAFAELMSEDLIDTPATPSGTPRTGS